MIDKIVVHCSDSPDDMEVVAEDIHEWHKQKGWDGIGYHYVVNRDGTKEIGRPHYWTGAHVKGHNEGSIGICLIGRNDFTAEQMTALKSLLYLLKFRYQSAAIYGHYELDDGKSCPNFNVKSWVEEEMPGINHSGE